MRRGGVGAATGGPHGHGAVLGLLPLSLRSHQNWNQNASTDRWLLDSETNWCDEDSVRATAAVP